MRIFHLDGKRWNDYTRHYQQDVIQTGWEYAAIRADLKTYVCVTRYMSNGMTVSYCRPGYDPNTGVYTPEPEPAEV